MFYQGDEQSSDEERPGGGSGVNDRPAPAINVAALEREHGDKPRAERLRLAKEYMEGPDATPEFAATCRAFLETFGGTLHLPNGGRVQRSAPVEDPEVDPAGPERAEYPQRRYEK